MQIYISKVFSSIVTSLLNYLMYYYQFLVHVFLLKETSFTSLSIQVRSEWI